MVTVQGSPCAPTSLILIENYKTYFKSSMGLDMGCIAVSILISKRVVGTEELKVC
jgi:hypothetical protein